MQGTCASPKLGHVRLFSWNVNGIRAAWKGGLRRWLARQKPDVVCLQEVKAHPDQLNEQMLHPLGYDSFWHPAEKRGYSGVAIYAKREPRELIYGLGRGEFDREGRVLMAEFSDFVLVNAYFPNSQRDHS